MGANSRLEDVTMTLYSSNAVDLIGINYPNGTSQNSKLRTTVLNVSSTGATSQSTIGVYSGGTSALSPQVGFKTRGDRNSRAKNMAQGFGIGMTSFASGSPNQFATGTNTFSQGTLRFLETNSTDITVLNGTGT